ncbi:MAG: hypothetical protein H7Z76_13675 [Methylotenera sp.]|nr:hypothetical protein [Flavobacterium sp.]
MLDADLIIANPSEFDTAWVGGIGKSKSASYSYTGRIKNIFNSRKNELTTLLNNGKILVVFLCPIKAIRGETNYGAAEYITNYDFLPSGKEFLTQQLTAGLSSVTNSIKLANHKHLFASYFKSLKDELEYSAYLEIENENNTDYFLQNRSNKPVGFSMTSGNGLIVFLPPPKNIDHAKMIGTFINCTKNHLTKYEETPPPNWVSEYQLEGENRYDDEITQISTEIDTLLEKRKNLESQKYELTIFKELLYEQGEKLEIVVLSFFKLIGFKAENRKLEDLEHDVVFESIEGKGIAEIEGKDNDAIHVGKIDQLNRAVDEDFDLIGSYAQGILIGNHYRLLNPENRKDAFTEKVMLVAKKKNFGLLTTMEIFHAIEKILSNPSDEDFKTSCRIKILNTVGQIIKFT